MLNGNEIGIDSLHDDFAQFDRGDEPGVINYTCLINLITQQAPPGEAGRLYHKDGIKLDEIEEIRIEFLRILKIDHLWIMTNLVKLSLAHNSIEKIEKLDALIKLRELDISFNSIKIMENLNCLCQLEILLLAGNQIDTIESIDNLKNLTIFSIADNRVNGWEHVLYLRKFKNLRSVNLAGNPCTLQDNYNNYLVAFLPQVLYFSYVMIDEENRNNATKMYWRSIVKLEDDEGKIEIALEKERAMSEKIKNDSAAFVDHLDEDELFHSLFLHDKEGIELKNINDDTLAIFNEYKVNFSAISYELYQFGIEQHLQRENEIKIFSDAVKEACDTVRDNARRTVDSIDKQRDEMLAKFDIQTNELNKKMDEKLTITNQSRMQLDVKITKMQNFMEEFNQFLSTIWTKLLYDEVVLHEQIEDINETFKLNIADMKDIFVETVQTLFTQMRSLMIDYRNNIHKIVLIYLNNITVNESTIPSHLLDICGDTSILSNTLASSHDIHLKTIDGHEDNTIHRMNEWFNDLIDQLHNEETMRHRRRILEISHILQYHRESVDNYILVKDNLASDVAAALQG